jgi:RNA polymerase sigma-70 factor (ECF subfamily)
VNEENEDIRTSVDHLFRRHAGQMVSILARHFGYQHLELVEDAVQDSLIAAMKKWPFSGVPQNPRAWLTETAKNRVIDQLRRSNKSEAFPDDGAFAAEATNDPLFSGEIEEDELRMIFACCHPAIPPDAQVALTLKTVGGFSVAEISRAFLSNNESTAKMLTRAKTRFRENVAELEVPSQDELLRRRNAVLKVLYLMFNEGYAASEGDDLVRKDLCFEAIRLATIVAAHPKTRAPKVNALLALFLFQGARLETRIDSHGELLLLEDQDRSRWDQRMLAEGLRHFRLSAAGDKLSEYHLEAEIAAVHALAADFASTDWRRILECYNELQRRKFSPVAELNRIVVIEKVSGVDAARSALDSLARSHDLSRLNLFHITKAHLLEMSGDQAPAVAELETALSLTSNMPVRRFIERKIASQRQPVDPYRSN